MSDRSGSSAPCLGCGASIARTGARAPIRHYCGPACRPRCAIDGCQTPRNARGWCPFHYTRWKLTGDPLTPLERQPHEGEVCAVEGCARPRRKVNWCTAHYEQVKRTGATSPLQLKSDSFVCFACGKATGVISGYRKFCSDRCKARWQAHDGAIPDAYDCILCQTSTPFLRADGRRLPSHTRLCKRCRAQTRFAVTAGQLAARDGFDCGICGIVVDMTLRAPDPLCASVDHIVPRSRGGLDTPENCQLAHLICNVRKGNRVSVLVESDC